MFLQFTEPNLAAEFRKFQKTDVNIQLGGLVSALSTVYFVTHLSYQTFWLPSNTTYLAAFLFGISTVLSATVSIGTRFAGFFPDVDGYFQWTLLRSIHKILVSLDQSSVNWKLTNDTLVISFSTASSLFMLARVLQGPCDPSATHWQDQQNCNNGGPAGLPTEEFILNLTSIFMCQIFLKGASLKAIFVSWLIKIAIIMACVRLAGVDTYWWVGFHILNMMAVSYEVSGWAAELRITPLYYSSSHITI